MRVILSFLLVISFLVGCSQTEEPVKEKEKVVENSESEKKVNEETEEPVKEKEKVVENSESEKKVNEETEEVKTKEPSIDTSVFQYAKKVEVTDARDITKHITVTVFMSDELKQGLAAQHALNQTYDFIQQEDIKGADTLTIGVMVGDKRVFQYTVDTAKFVPDDAEPMTNVVLASSKVEKITPEVEDFATAFEWKMNR